MMIASGDTKMAVEQFAQVFRWPYGFSKSKGGKTPDTVLEARIRGHLHHLVAIESYDRAIVAMKHVVLSDKIPEATAEIQDCVAEVSVL
jgi:hypothetical protein